MNFYVPSSYTFDTFFDTRIPEARSQVDEDANGYYIQLDAPGISKEDLKISAEGKFLQIEGERKGRFAASLRKTFSLPDDVDADKIQAQLKDGVLELSLPKKEQIKPKTINVQDAKGSFFDHLLGAKKTVE